MRTYALDPGLLCDLFDLPGKPFQLLKVGAGQLDSRVLLHYSSGVASRLILRCSHLIARPTQMDCLRSMKGRGSIKKGVAEVLLAGIQNDVRVGSLNAGKREHRLREGAEIILASELRDDCERCLSKSRGKLRHALYTTWAIFLSEYVPDVIQRI